MWYETFSYLALYGTAVVFKMVSHFVTAGCDYFMPKYKVLMAKNKETLKKRQNNVCPNLGLTGFGGVALAD